MAHHAAERGAVADQREPDRPVRGDGDVARAAVRERRARAGEVDERRRSDRGVDPQHAAPGRHPELPVGVGGDVGHPRRPRDARVSDHRKVDVREVEPAVLGAQKLRDAALLEGTRIAADPRVAVGADPDRLVAVPLDAGIGRSVVAPPGAGKLLRREGSRPGSEADNGDQRADEEPTIEHGESWHATSGSAERRLGQLPPWNGTAPRKARGALRPVSGRARSRSPARPGAGRSGDRAACRRGGSRSC